MSSTFHASVPRDSGLLRRLIDVVASPGAVDFWVQKVLPAWSCHRSLARVVSRHVTARDTVTLVLAPNRVWHTLGGFVPGQHVNVTAEVGGVRITRSYSPCDVPRADGHVAITVRQVAGGKLSGHLVHQVRVGDVLELGAAFGDLTWPIAPQGRWMLLAAGSGITPLISLMRDLAKRTLPQVSSVTLVYWARTAADLCFAQELRDLAATDPRVHVKFVLTQEPEAAADGRSRLSAESLSSVGLDRVDGAQVYACGPAGFVQTARELLAGRAAMFKAEAFTPVQLLGDDSETVPVFLKSSGRVLNLPVGQTLLTALEAEGLRPAFGCRMGICRTCVCPKLAGATRDLLTGEVDAEPASALKLCVSTPRSALTLDL